MEREPASDIITGAGSPSPRIDACSFHKKRARRKKERKTCSIRGKVGGRFKEESKERKESKEENKEGEQRFNKPNEKARAEDETDSKEKTEANVKEDASRRIEAENQAEASSWSSSHQRNCTQLPLGAWERLPPSVPDEAAPHSSCLVIDLTVVPHSSYLVIDSTGV